MRYPVTATGSKIDFERDWYIPQGGGFASPRYNSSGVLTYYHEGLDINLRTGGDTDLNQELKAIANGKIEYYHNFHSGTSNTFGRHLVYRIDGPWGTRWVHYAHCNDLDFHGSPQDVTEGQVIARVGKSGLVVGGSAHLHMSIFKVDPVAFEIDNIANTLAECNQYWEDPIAFINTWIAAAPIPTPPVAITDPSTRLDFQNMTTPIETYGILDFGTVKSKIQAKDSRIKELENKINNARAKAQETVNALN